MQSFWYSTLLSALYEYGAEALAEPVSAQDLVVTPVAGFLVGHYLVSPLRRRIREQPGELGWTDKAILFLTDPLGVVNAQTDRLFGVKTTLQWQPMRLQNPVLPAGADRASASRPGLARRPLLAWGLQVRLEW